MIAEEQFLEPEGMLISMASESGITVSISSVVVESFKGGERINWRDLTLATWGSSGLYIVVSGSSSAVYCLTMIRQRNEMVNLVLEEKAQALCSGKTVGDLLRTTISTLGTKSVDLLVGKKVVIAPKNTSHHDPAPAPPINGFADDPSRLFFTLGSCTVEANCALSGIETDHRPLGNVLDESSVRRIVEEVVQRENAKLLLAIEQLLAKNRQ